MSSEGGPGFLPGHASLAYFFRLGSEEATSGSSTLTRVVGTARATGCSMGADRSTSGAGLGMRGKPSFEAIVDENKLEWDDSRGRPP